MEALEIISLPTERWREYKALRLRSLAEDAPAFGSAYGPSAAYPDDYWTGRLRDALDGSRSLLLFAQVGGELVGMLGAFIGDEPAAPDVATIVSVYVPRERRGRGVGARLLTALLTELERRPGLRAARLGVVAEQEAAVRLYRRCGFAVVGVERHAMGDGVERDELVMERALRGAPSRSDRGR